MAAGIRLTQEEYIESVRKVHGDRYDLSNVQYVNGKTKIEVTCHKHGAFLCLPFFLNRGGGCAKCGKESMAEKARLPAEEFLRRWNDIHGDRYDYSKVEYVNTETKVEIICKLHGSFWQTPNSHTYAKAGCSTCSIIKVAESHIKSNEQFILDSKKVHGELYDYSLSKYNHSKGSVEIICSIHGSFWQRPNNHLNGAGCPKCSSIGVSTGETEVGDFLEGMGIEVIRNSKSIIPPQEIDLVIESHKLCIEYNGLYWHSEQAGKPRNYHIDKLEKVNAAGYELVQIFEDEWLTKRSKVEDLLRKRMGLSSKVLQARKLSVEAARWREVKEFLEETHIQGSGVPCRYNVVLKEGQTVVACLSFNPLRFETGSFSQVELMRYAYTYPIIGGFNKMLRFFLKQQGHIQEIITYSDRRLFSGKLYLESGFEFDSNSTPSHYWCNNRLERQSRFKFQKHKLEKIFSNFDPGLSEDQNCVNNSYFKVYDCGTSKWKYRRPA